MRFLVILFCAFIVTACGSPSSSGDTTQSPTDTPQEILSLLPEEPSPETNSATIAGVDADEDGVRDDIQRYIVLSSFENKNSMNAQLMVAKAMQQTLVSDLEEESVQSTSEFVTRSMACSTRIEGGFEHAEKKIDVLAKAYLDTEERVEQYFKFGQAASGRPAGAIQAGVPTDTLCDFAVE